MYGVYKRYWLGAPQAETSTLGGVVSFLAFVSIVVWAVPLAMESVSGMPLELFLVPPAWRGEIMCGTAGDAEREYAYAYRDGACVKVCNVPGCGFEGESGPAHPREVWEANLREARSGIDLSGIFWLAITVIKYGAVVAALASLGIMRVSGARAWPAWGWACVPCAAWAVAAALEPALLPAGLAALAAAYASDIWSTARFGGRALRDNEYNPLLRALFRRYAMRTALALHTAAYMALVACVSYALGQAGPLPWDALLAAMAFGLAGVHVWVAAGNVRVYAGGARGRQA